MRGQWLVAKPIGKDGPAVWAWQFRGALNLPDWLCGRVRWRDGNLHFMSGDLPRIALQGDYLVYNHGFLTLYRAEEFQKLFRVMTQEAVG